MKNKSRAAARVKFWSCTLFAFVLTSIILLFPTQCLPLALNGLNLWFERMIPTLFPFMVLSGIIIRMNLTGSFVKVLNPLIGRLFRVSPACVYGMTVGFLCGFPMGAHVAVQLLDQKQISETEASFLLFFCNNIGPVYFLSFALPALSLEKKGIFLFGMYGLPLLYGLILRCTLFRNLISKSSCALSGQKPLSLLAAMDESVFSALLGIARLGGYMIFFNLLFILPELLAGMLPLSEGGSLLLTGALDCFLEITGGINLLGDKAPFLVLCILPFGGFSCIAQTYSMIRGSGLSIREYVMHKMILTAITVFYYLLMYHFSAFCLSAAGKALWP